MFKIGKVAARKTHREQIRPNAFDRDLPFSLKEDAVSQIKAHIATERKLLRYEEKNSSIYYVLKV